MIDPMTGTTRPDNPAILKVNEYLKEIMIFCYLGTFVIDWF